jgi:hypothetical protein
LKRKKKKWLRKEGNDLGKEIRKREKTEKGKKIKER